MKKISISHVNVRQSITVMLFKILIADIIVAVIIGFAFSFLSSSQLLENKEYPITTVSYFVFLILSILELFATVYVVLVWLNDYYEISPYAITHKHGLIYKKIERHSLQNIKNVEVNQGIFGKMLNFGTILLFDWRMQKNIPLSLIHNPIKYIHILEDLLPNIDEEKTTIFGKERDSDE